MGEIYLYNSRTKPFPIGFHEFDDTIVIPRHRLDMGYSHAHGDRAGLSYPSTDHLRVGPGYGLGAPPAWNGDAYSLPAGSLWGEDWSGTMLIFGLGVQDVMIKTEYAGDEIVSFYWMNNNTVGNSSWKGCQGATINQMAIHGRGDLAGITYAQYLEDPAVLTRRVDGIRIEGPGMEIDHVRMFDIPGTAITSYGGQGFDQFEGTNGPYDDYNPRVNNVIIWGCENGIVMESGDCNLSNIWITGCLNKGLVAGVAMYVHNIHVTGADVAFDCRWTSFASEAYFEAARIGVHIHDNGHGTELKDCNIGPGTCFYRGVLIEGDNGVRIGYLYGKVSAPTLDWPDRVGLEIRRDTPDTSYAYSAIGHHIAGDLEVLGSSIGYLIEGRQHKLDLRGSVTDSDGTVVKVTAPIYQIEMQVTGIANAGTLLDLSASGLDEVDGAGNIIRVYGTSVNDGTLIKYPDGNPYYNLKAGTSLFIDDVLQGPDLSPGLVEYWPMSEQSSGSSAASINTSSPNFALTPRSSHAPSFNTSNPGVYESARDFDSSDGQCLFLNNDSAFALGTGASFTLGLWFKLSAASGDHVLASKNGYFTTASSGWDLLYNGASSGYLKLETFSTEHGTQNPGAGGSGYVVATALDFGTSYSADVWYCAMAGFNAAKSKVFIRVDASNINTDTQTVIWNSVAKLSFGCDDENSGYRAFNGQLGPAAYWNRALSDVEMDAFYNAGAGLKYGASYSRIVEGKVFL